LNVFVTANNIICKCKLMRVENRVGKLPGRICPGR